MVLSEDDYEDDNDDDWFTTNADLDVTEIDSRNLEGGSHSQ